MLLLGAPGPKGATSPASQTTSSHCDQIIPVTSWRTRASGEGRLPGAGGAGGEHSKGEAGGPWAKGRGWMDGWMHRAGGQEVGSESSEAWRVSWVKLLVQGRPPVAEVEPGRRLFSGQHWRQQYKQKPTYLVSEYLQVINQANKLLNKICSVLLP